MSAETELSLLTTLRPNQLVALNKLPALRAHAIGDHVDFPQLVFCSGQSAGKSFVMEGINDLPFPSLPSTRRRAHQIYDGAHSPAFTR